MRGTESTVGPISIQQITFDNSGLNPFTLFRNLYLPNMNVIYDIFVFDNLVFKVKLYDGENEGCMDLSIQAKTNSYIQIKNYKIEAKFYQKMTNL